MAWEWRENNREKVLESLQKGEYEAILTSRTVRWMRWRNWRASWECLKQ